MDGGALVRAIAELGDAQGFIDDADSDAADERQEALDAAGLCAIKALMDVMDGLAALRQNGAEVAASPVEDDALAVSIANFPAVARDALATAELLYERMTR